MHMYLFQENLRYDKMAEGLGARGEYVRTQDEFRKALKTSYEIAAKERVSTLINVQALEGVHFGQRLSAGQHHQSRAGRRSACPLKQARPATPVDIVTAILEGYAEKAVFRGFSAHPRRGGKATYRMVWHYDRPFELVLDVPGKTLRFPAVLPGVPARSAMYRELRAFLKARQSAAMPEHRRVNPAKARVTLSNQRGAVSLKFTVKDGDFEYADAQNHPHCPRNLHGLPGGWSLLRIHGGAARPRSRPVLDAVLQPDVPHLDFHRLAGVKLNPDQALQLAIGARRHQSACSSRGRSGSASACCRAR